MVKCPHCGVAQREASIGEVELTPEQVRALLAVDGSLAPAHIEGESPGLFGGLVLPHPMTSGAARISEIGLSFVGGPLLLCALLLLAMLAKTRTRIYASDHSEFGKLAAVTMCGAPTYAWVLAMAGLPMTGWLTLVGISITALVARYVIRRRASRGSLEDLDELAKPDKEPDPEAPSRPPKAWAVKAPPLTPPKSLAPPAPPKPYEDGDEPSFLK